MLCELNRAGFEINLLLSSETSHRSLYREAGISLMTHEFSKTSLFSSAKRVSEAVEELRPDLIHCFTKKALQSVVLARLLYGNQALKNASLLGYRGIIGNLSRFDPFSWLGFLNPKVDRISCVCHAVKSYLDTFPNLRGKTLAIHKGHEPSWYEGLPPELDLPKDVFVVSCLCNLRPRKGLKCLLEALSMLPESVHLLLIGNMGSPGRGQPDLETLCRDLSIEGRVHSIGFQERGWRFLKHSSVFVMPSLRREGFPKAVIEAMAQGIPPVVTSVGGMAEQVEDGVNGRVVEPGDARALSEALRGYQENPEISHAHGESARRTVEEKFRFSDTCASYQELYLQLLGHSKPYIQGEIEKVARNS